MHANPVESGVSGQPLGGIRAKVNRAYSSLRNTAGKGAWVLSAALLAFAVALPEELPAAPIVRMTSIQPTFERTQTETRRAEALLVHCCHAHPLPPYDGYCCHSGGAVYVQPGYGYGYGAASVRGQSRRVARRTSRRVSRRR